jgi:hypothetical protein
MQAGFVDQTSSNATLPTGAVTTGFSIFGTQVVYYDSDSQILSQFWAQTTDDESVWRVVWNSDGEAEDDSVPVVLKSTPLTTED